MLSKILGCYFFLSIANIGIFGYEWGIIGMTLDQSLVLRFVTLITDMPEAILFVCSNFFQTITAWMLRKINCQWSWAESGLKLALIGSLLYLIKMIFVDEFLDLQDTGVAPIGRVKILLAFTFSFILSFCWGVALNLFLEKYINSMVSTWSNYFQRKK